MYYVLFIRYNGVWSPEFGDADKDAVTFERNDYKDGGIKARDLKIVKFDRKPSRKACTAKAAEMTWRYVLEYRPDRETLYYLPLGTFKTKAAANDAAKNSQTCQRYRWDWRIRQELIK